MITFLPSTDFGECARMLDDKRLGGQRTEAWAILKWLRNPKEYAKLVQAGYCQMWLGHEDALVMYLNEMLREWAHRGKVNDILQPGDPALGLHQTSTPQMPPWLGSPELHACHRSALMAKLPEHYGQFGWKETGADYNGSYLWPVCCDKTWVLRWPKALKLAPLPIKPVTPVPRGSARSELIAEYNRLTKVALPALAAANKWPIRWDHCFQRLVLDTAYGGCWYDHIDRKKGPAIHQISDAPLARAVAAAQRMEEEGVEVVRELNEASLKWRGKTSKRKRIV